MAGRRGATAVLLLMSLVCVPPARPTPFIAQHAGKVLTTQPPRGLTTATGGAERQDGGWSLKDTVARLDNQLQRHNDYNDVMLESGEEDDQLSRLLFKLQHPDRVREGWYDDITSPPPPPRSKHRQDKTGGHKHKGRREARGYHLQ